MVERHMVVLGLATALVLMVGVAILSRCWPATVLLFFASVFIILALADCTPSRATYSEPAIARAPPETSRADKGRIDPSRDPIPTGSRGARLSPPSQERPQGPSQERPQGPSQERPQDPSPLARPNVVSCAGPNVVSCVTPSPACTATTRFGSLVSAAYEAARSEMQPIIAPDECSTRPPLCPLNVEWQAAFKGCPSTFVDGPRCEIYPRNPALWRGDLNPVLQERAMLAGEVWDPYKHFHARQMLSQFVWKDVNDRPDQYCVPVGSPEEAYCFTKERSGVPEYLDL